MLLYQDLTDEIIHCFYQVYNSLGYGFLEKVYENALKYELEKKGLEVTQQKSIQVYYEEQIVGNYFADLLVENKIILELKAGEMEDTLQNHELQLYNYLKATKYEVGLVLLFGKKPIVKRKIFTNDNK